MSDKAAKEWMLLKTWHGILNNLSLISMKTFWTQNLISRKGTWKNTNNKKAKVRMEVLIKTTKNFWKKQWQNFYKKEIWISKFRACCSNISLNLRIITTSLNKERLAKRWISIGNDGWRTRRKNWEKWLPKVFCHWWKKILLRIHWKLIFQQSIKSKAGDVEELNFDY